VGSSHMDGTVLSHRARRRLIVAAALGVSGYAAYCAWRDNERLRKAVRSTASELQRCSEAALTRTTACVVAGAVRGVAAVRPQVRSSVASAIWRHHFCHPHILKCSTYRYSKHIHAQGGAKVTGPRTAVQAVETPELREPWQAVALEKLVGLLTTNAGMDLVSLAVAVGAQHR
jgi:hypothetical protein